MSLRFWAKTRPVASGCIEWVGTTTLAGYGQIRAPGRGRFLYAHRVAFALRHGREPRPGLEIDHVCRNRRCVNPDHLREVSHRENMENGASALKRACCNGHPFDDANTYQRLDRRGRQCRRCKVEAKRRYDDRNQPQARRRGNNGG